MAELLFSYFALVAGTDSDLRPCYERFLYCDIQDNNCGLDYKRPFHTYASLFQPPPLLDQDWVYVLLRQCENCIPGAPVKMWDLACSNCVSAVVPD